MGFSSVYRALQEVFPQVDARMLKAVAIEHSKDADAAVEFILSEVLPFMSEQSVAPSSSFENQEFRGPLNGGVACEEQSALLKHQPVVEEANAGPSSKSESVVHEDANDTDHINNFILAESTLLDENLNGASVSNFYDANDDDRVCGNTESNDLPIHQEIYVKAGAKQTSQSSSVSLMQEGCGVNGCLNDDSHTDLAVSNGPMTNDFHTVNHRKDRQENVSLDRNTLELGNYLVQLAQLPVKEHTLDSPECGLRSERGFDQFAHVSSATSMQENSSLGGCLNDDSQGDSGNSNGAVAYEFNTTNNSEGHHGPLCLNGDKLEVQNSVLQLTPSYVKEHMPDAPECALQSEFDLGTCIVNFDKLQLSVSVDTASKEDTSGGEMVDFGDGPTLSNIVTGSGQICRIDLLEDIIEDAKSNKKTLFSAVDSLINLMREVELQEKAVEEAKEEAARGGVDILARVEEIKQMLRHAKEANDMHAGEVYGEKAILATEARELQTRLLCLSDERDKSLAILDKMHQTLEARLAAAEEERKAAEQEKLDKENSARAALAEQELIMEKVVKESKILQQEAEENSKLREFLIDRGRLVDILQGEISVICQDVRLLKENFDEHVPLSKSISSSQTSCILASSSSSLKSTASDWVSGQAESSETPKNTSPTPSVGSLTPKSSHGEKRARDDHKALLDDGWDVFDKDAELYS